MKSGLCFAMVVVGYLAVEQEARAATCTSYPVVSGGELAGGRVAGFALGMPINDSRGSYVEFASGTVDGIPKTCFRVHFRTGGMNSMGERLSLRQMFVKTMTVAMTLNYDVAIQGLSNLNLGTEVGYPIYSIRKPTQP